LDETLIEKLKGIRIGAGFTSAAALPASTFLKGKVKGLVFTGAHDGRVALVYDSTVAVPFAWKLFNRKRWSSIDKSSLKPALRKSALGDWKAEKYDIDYEALLAKLSKLPADKRIIKGDLNLRDANITPLPTNLQVYGSIYLTGTNITSLPVGLKVGGSLSLNGTKITSLPAGFQVGGYLNLSYTKITSLPADLKVGSWLDLSNTKITSLPADLKVGGFLDLSNVSIISLPADLQVGGAIYSFAGDKSQVPMHLRSKLK